MKKVLPFLFILFFVIAGFSSCQNESADDGSLFSKENQPPTARPLKFSSVKNIDPASIKPSPVKPVISKFNFNKLLSRSYDTAATRPIHYNTEENKIDYNSLPAKDFDLEKLPAKALKMTVTKLAPPKIIRIGQPTLKNAALGLFEVSGIPRSANNILTCVFRDRDNFIWICTEMGIYRYDGENLLCFVEGPFDTFFIDMLEDSQGRLWISSVNGGLATLDIKNGTFSKTASLADTRNDFSFILQDKQQRIWETTAKRGGVSIIDPNTLLVRQLDNSNGLTSRKANSLTLDRSGQVWIATNNGINIINPQSKKIKFLSKSNGLKSDTTFTLFCDGAGNIWMDDKGGCVFNTSTGSFKIIYNDNFFKKNAIINFSQDRDGKIWMASQRNGVGIIDPINQTLQNIKKENGLDSNFLLKVVPDKRGQIWMAALKGLNKLNYVKSLLEHIDNLPVNTLFQDNSGLIWEGTSKGINIIDRKNKTYRRIGKEEGLFNDTTECIIASHSKMYLATNGGIDIIDSLQKTITHFGLKEGLPERRINAVWADKKGRVWLAGEKRGIYIFNPVTTTIQHIGKEQGVNEQEFIDIKEDKKGNIWLSTVADIYKITPDLKTVSRLSLGNGIKPLLIDNTGNIWIGTPGGIFIIDKANENIISFSSEQGFTGYQIFSLLKYNDHIYAGTLRGITVIDVPKGDLLTNKKWVSTTFSTHYGLTKINAGYSLTDFITHDGLYCWGDNGISVYDLSKKDTATSTSYITGVNIMDGHQYFTGEKPTAINKLRWDNTTGPYNLPLNLQLPYNQNYIQFNYSVLNLTPHDTTWYKYRLRGVEKNWTVTTTSGSTKNYYNVAPGTYIFELSSKTDIETWSPVKQFTFVINPPWWQTWWAYAIYILLFTGSIWGFAHFRSRKLINDKRLLELKVNERTEEVLQQKEEIEAQRDNLEKAFKELKTAQAQLVQAEKMASLGELTAGIAHEIQNPLNFVNNFSEVNTELIDEMQEELDHGNYEEVKALAGDIKQNQEKISQHGKRADSIVKGMLQHSRTNSGERQLTNVNTLADEFFKLSYHGLRAKDKNFNADMVSNFDPDLPKINIVQQDIGRVLLNLFNNAFYAVNEKKKKADKSYKPEVSITTSRDDKHVIIAVKDNGTGIPDAIKEKIMQPFFTSKPTGEGTGLGLSLTYDMVVKGHGGKIELNTKEGEFTEFVVILPLA